MIDSNTKYHFFLALVGTLLISYFIDDRFASAIVGTAIITWEIAGVRYLIRHYIKVKFFPIFWDILTGVIDAIIGCALTSWIQAIGV